MEDFIKGDADTARDGSEEDDQSDPMGDEQSHQKERSNEIHLGVGCQIPGDAVTLEDKR